MGKSKKKNNNSSPPSSKLRSSPSHSSTSPNTSRNAPETKLFADSNIKRPDTTCSDSTKDDEVSKTNDIASFLMDCFPDISREEIVRLLKESNDNLNATTSALTELSEDVADDSSTSSRTSSSNTSGSSASVSSPPSCVVQPPPTRTNRTRNPKANRVQNLSVKTTTSIQQTTVSTPITADLTAFPPITNSPSRINDEKDVLDRLSKLFPDKPVEEMEISARFSKGNLNDAIEILFTGTLPSSYAQEDIQSFPNQWVKVTTGTAEYDRDPKISQISEIFPQLPSKKIHFALIQCDNNLERSVQFLSNQLDEEQKHGKLVFQYNSMRSNAPVANNVPQSVVSTTRIHTSEPHKYDVTYSRNMASVIAQQRGEMFSKAANAFRKGDLTGRSAASHYAEVGRKLTQEMEEWNRKAAATIVASNSEKLEKEHTVDLHGFTTKESIEYVQECLYKWFSTERTSTFHKSPLKPLTFIVGSGNKRGEFGKGSKLFTAVHGFLVREGWRVECKNDNAVIVVRGLKE